MVVALTLSAARADVLLKAVAPVDSNSFPTPTYASVLNGFGSGACSILSVQPDAITGLEARRNYFPDITNIYSFQLLHITRVSALIPTSDNAGTMQRLRQELAQACAAAGVGVVAIDTVGDPPARDWLASLPTSVTIALAIGWAFTATACGVGWIIYMCCCGKPKPPIVPAANIPTAVPKQPVVTPPTAPPKSLIAPTAPPIVVMRLPSELSARSAYQSDPCAAPAHPSGPCAIRLASWSERPNPPRP